MSGLLEECWSDFEARAAGHEMTVAFDVCPDLSLFTDPEKLSIVLRNLMDNAVSHGDAGGKISISARIEGGRLELMIVNTASKTSPGLQEKVFDRFWRGDAARSSDGGHCGLGLSLCLKITEMLGGKIEAGWPMPGEFRVKLAFEPPVQDAPGTKIL